MCEGRGRAAALVGCVWAGQLWLCVEAVVVLCVVCWILLATWGSMRLVALLCMCGLQCSPLWVSGFTISPDSCESELDWQDLIAGRKPAAYIC
jgi:hypothetical protein